MWPCFTKGLIGRTSNLRVNDAASVFICESLGLNSNPRSYTQNLYWLNHLTSLSLFYQHWWKKAYIYYIMIVLFILLILLVCVSSVITQFYWRIQNLPWFCYLILVCLFPFLFIKCYLVFYLVSSQTFLFKNML